MRELIDDTAAQLEQLCRERERLQYAQPPTAIRAECVRAQRERVDEQIARLKATRT